MTSGRVVELRRTFQDHILDALGSSMAMRDDGSNIGLTMLLYCSHALCVTIKLILVWLYTQRGREHSFGSKHIRVQHADML